MRALSGRLFNLCIIVLIAFALLRPAGPLGAKYLDWREERSTDHLVSSDWRRVSAGSRLDSSASARLVEFVDYECPICKSQHELISQLMDTGAVEGIVIRHFPLSRYRRSDEASRAAICAEAQGRFAAMHEQLYMSKEWIVDANWEREARAALVPDLDTFLSCLQSDETTQRLESDIAIGRELGLHGTPAYAHPDLGMHIGSMTELELVSTAGRP